MQNNKNFVLFLVLSLGLMFGGIWVSNKLWPPPEKKKPDDAKVVKADKDKDKKEKEKKPEVEPPRPRPRLQPIPAAARKFITLGAASDNLKALLDPLGAGVRSVWLNRFQQADALGLPEWIDVDGKRVPKPLELVTEELNRVTPSHVLYHLDPTRKGHDPLPDLGQRLWDVQTSEEEGVVRRVEFSTEIDGVRISKIFTLKPEDYHIGLEVRLERVPAALQVLGTSVTGLLGTVQGQGPLLAASALVPGRTDADDKPIPFRYQLTSAHGLRIEGEWYASVLRNALIGWHDTKRDSFTRTLEEARRINYRSGGDPVEVVNGDKRIRWAGVAVQFFASMLVVDNEGQENQDFLSRARPTLEGAAVKGRIKSIAEGRQRFVLLGQDNIEHTFQAHPDLVWPINLNLREGAPVAVVFTTDEYDQQVALEFLPEDRTEPLFFNDIVARVTTEPLELKPGGEPIVHRYLLYNGPVKARLLGYLEGKEREVSPELVTRYEKTLHLNTITDYPSMAFTEQLDAYLYFTRLLVACTNLMHSVLWFLHTYVMPWSYGLCILLLTVLVRGMMFPISRKQAMTSMRMQELAPELKKLQEKHKGDKQALGMAQMELYRKHGVNPLGTCWIIFLQMPIFLGLYYCLQESIMFRLAPFMWVRNLAAPDMLFWWSEQIPWISRPMDYGSFLYLGPFFNLLPVVAAALMIVQQSLMTPPAMDEQQAMQMKMMKYMMVIFGLMFYKVAAGLCVYFIASSLWGFAERKLLPKKKPAPGTAPEPESQGGLVKKLREGVDGLRGAVSPTPSSQETNGPAGKKGKRRKGKGGSAPVPAAPPADGVSGKVRSWWGGLREWWAEVRRQAEKKG